MTTQIGLDMTVYDPAFNPILYSRCEDSVFVVNSPDFVAATTPSRGATLSTWHKRLRHTNYAYIEKLRDRIEISNKDRPFCEPCTKGKQHKVHSKQQATHRSATPGERHVDLVGGQNTLKDTQGFNMSAILTDDATHRRFSYPVKTRDDAAIKVQEHIILAEAQYGYMCKQLHSDDDSVFKPIQPRLASRGIKRELSAPYAQDQDGIAERSIRTLIEKARTMRIQAGLPGKLWTYILSAAAYLDALVPSSSLPQGKTPYQLYEGEMPDYSHLRIFGCTAYILDYQAKSHGKLAARSHAGVLVGCAAKNQWLIWDGRSVKVRRDVVFHESNLHYYKADVVNLPVGEPLAENDVFSDILPTTVGDTPIPTQPQPTKTINLPLTDDGEDTYRICLERADDSIDSKSENGRNEDHTRGGGRESDQLPDNDSNGDSENSTPPPPPAKRRQVFKPQEGGQKRQSGRLQTQERKNYRAAHQGPSLPRLTKKDQVRSKTKEPDIRDTINMDTGDIIMSATTRPVPHIPQSYEEAISGPDRDMWVKAMTKEIRSAMSLRAWDLARLPAGVKPIDGKWVYTPKTDVKGNFIEAKARWVARGFQQVKGVDYDETYAATIQPDTTRMLLAIAAVKGWKVHQMDVSVAYLHAHQKDYHIYLRQPKGFEHGNGNLYCRMDKGLYGLKQSGNLWFDEAAGTFITKLGLTQSKYDPALFFNRKKQLYVTLYVDDF